MQTDYESSMKLWVERKSEGSRRWLTSSGRKKSRKTNSGAAHGTRRSRSAQLIVLDVIAFWEPPFLVMLQTTALDRVPRIVSLCHRVTWMHLTGPG